MQIRNIEKQIIKIVKKIEPNPSKHKLDLCKDRARAIYEVYKDLSDSDILDAIKSEAEEIAWEEI